MAYPKIKVKIGKGREPIELQQVRDPDLKTYNKLVAAAINEVYSKIQNGGVIKVDGELSTTSINPVQNKVIAKALESKLSAAALTDAILEALAQARDSGEFDGKDGPKGDPGFSPTISVKEVEEGHEITITNETGEPHVFVVTNGKDGAGGVGGSALKPGDNIKIEDGVISVMTADEVEKDNTKPITAAAVHTQLGNIEILLKTI